MVLLRHLRRLQPSPSFIVCFEPSLGTFSGRRGGGTHCASGWVSSLFNQIQQDELSAAWPRFLTVVLSLPVQKTVTSLTVLEILCNRSPRERSTFSNLCLHTLTGVLRISLFFLSLVSYHGTFNSITIWSSSSVLTKAHVLPEVRTMHVREFTSDSLVYQLFFDLP